jgi:hypothetical protein
MTTVTVSPFCLPSNLGLQDLFEKVNEANQSVANFKLKEAVGFSLFIVGTISSIALVVFSSMGLATVVGIATLASMVIITIAANYLDVRAIKAYTAMFTLASSYSEKSFGLTIKTSNVSKEEYGVTGGYNEQKRFFKISEFQIVKI